MLWLTGKTSRHAVVISLFLPRIPRRSSRYGLRPFGSGGRRFIARLALALGVGPLSGSAGWALDGTAETPPVAPASTDAPSALIASLRSRILAAHSATLALEGWCADYKLAADPHLVAERVPGVDKPLTAAQRTRLAIGPDEPVRYRRVRLACGDRVLSEADNWYVPARLTPEMNATLDGTRTPFGRVVRPLAPVRSTVAVREPAPHADPGREDPLFEVDAVLSTGAGQPFCEVVETYLGGALPRASR